MLATSLLLQQVLPACDQAGDEDDACHLALGPYVDEGGKAYEIKQGYDGHKFFAWPNCVKCGNQFAAPETGRICCVCIAANS